MYGKEQQKSIQILYAVAYASDIVTTDDVKEHLVSSTYSQEHNLG